MSSSGAAEDNHYPRAKARRDVSRSSSRVHTLPDGSTIPILEPASVKRRDRIIAEGSVFSIPVEDLTGGVEGGRELLRRSAIQPIVTYGSPFSDTTKPIATGFFRRDKLYFVRGVGYELFGPPSADRTAWGRDLPDDVVFCGTLRNSQIPVMKNMMTRLKALEGTGTQLLVNDTEPGGGKTCMAIALALGRFVRDGDETQSNGSDERGIFHVGLPFQSRGYTLFIARGRRIVNQWVQNLVQFGVPRHLIGIMLGGRIVLKNRPVVVASVDTLVSRGHLYPLSFWRQFRMTVFDEAHHMNTRTFSEVFVRCAHSRFVISLTGTWERSDGTSPQLRYMTGLPVGGAKNTMPVDVQMKSYLAGTTEFVAQPSRRDETDQNDARANTALMITKLGEDEGRTRWIQRNLEEFVEEGGKTLVIVDRNDMREQLAERCHDQWGHREDLRKRYPVLKEIPVPDTPLPRLLSRIDKLEAWLEDESVKRKPRKTEQEQKQRSLKRFRTQLKYDTLHEAVRIAERSEDAHTGDLTLWVSEWKDEMRAIRKQYSGISRRSRVSEDEIWWKKLGLEFILHEIEKEECACEKDGDTLESDTAAFRDWIQRTWRAFVEKVSHTPSWNVITREEGRVAGIPLIEQHPSDTELYPLVGVLRGGISDIDAERAKHSRIILANAAYAREALDIADLDRLILEKPMANVKQVVGRIRRMHPNKKTPVKIFDVVDNVDPFTTYAFVRLRYYRKQQFRVQWTECVSEFDTAGTPHNRSAQDHASTESISREKPSLHSILDAMES